MSRFRFFIGEALEMLARDRAGALASLTALTAVLFLLAVVLLAGMNVRGLARNLEERKGLEVFLSDGVDSLRVRELEGIFRSFGEVQDVRFVSRDAALEEIEQDLGGIDVVGALGENPLSPAFQITLTPAAASRPGVLQELAREMGEYEGIDEVVFGGSWIETLERGIRNVYLTTAGAGLLAAIAVVLVLWNTVKLAFLGRLPTVRILKIVGATSAFIRTPYLLLGSLQTAFASVLALGLAAFVRFAIGQMMPGLRFLTPATIALFIAGAILLGMLSSFAAVEPALRNLERRSESVTS
jgi:cell division transport system permease protein